MHDEFRVHVRLDPHAADALVSKLGAIEPSTQTRRDLGRIAVSHEGGDLFLYADSLSAALEARRAVEAALTELDLHEPAQLLRWHPLEQRWEDAAEPLPTTDDEREAELAERDRAQDAESREEGFPAWEVRVTLSTREQAGEFADRLEAEGTPVVRRWRHVMVGAEDQDAARALAQRVRAEAPAGSEVAVEGAGLPFWDMLHPFAVFGGIAN